MFVGGFTFVGVLRLTALHPLNRLVMHFDIFKNDFQEGLLPNS